MASVSRPLLSLRSFVGQRGISALRYSTRSESTPPELPETESEAQTSRSAESTTPELFNSTDSAPSSNDASSSSASASPSSGPSKRALDPLMPNVHIPSISPYGPTSQHTPSKSKFQPPVPLSHKILPLTPNPMPPWEKGQKPMIFHVNYPRPMFPTPKPSEIPETLGGDMTQRREQVLCAITGLSQGELRGLRRCTVAMRWVVNMTSKGKMRSSLAYVVVGDPKKGLVGLGRGKGPSHAQAVDNAFFQACLEMDYVNRYENRTLWGQGDELKSKFGAANITLRARPPGFGLQVPYSIHRVLTACGIRDASASIDKSKEPIQVMKAVIQLLHGGANPAGLGNGLGGRGKRENKGASMRSKEEIERARGRYGVDIGLRV